MEESFYPDAQECTFRLVFQRLQKSKIIIWGLFILQSILQETKGSMEDVKPESGWDLSQALCKAQGSLMPWNLLCGPDSGLLEVNERNFVG